MKKSKRLISLLLACVMVMTLLPATELGAQALTAGYSESAYMRYAIKSNSFDVQGMPAAGQSTSTDVKTTYGNGGYYTYIKNSDTNTTSGTSINPFGGSFSTDGTTVQLSTDLEFVAGGRYVQVTYTLRNAGSASTTVDIGFGADTMVYQTDRAPIEETAKGLRMYSNAGKKMDAPTDYMFDLVVKDVDGSAQSASSIWFGYWSRNSQNIFTPSPATDAGSANSSYAVLAAGTPSIRGDNTGYVSTANPNPFDSGLAASWQGISLPAGESKTIKFQFGVLQKADMAVDVTDATTDGGTGSFTVSVAGGSGAFEYGYLYNATTAPSGAMNAVPTGDSAGKWQTDSGFSLGIAPGYYRVFYRDKADHTVNGFNDIIVYKATKVTYNPVDATMPGGTTTVYGGRGGSLTLPTPIKAGYAFTGWKVTAISDDSRKDNVYSGGAVFQIPGTNSSNSAVGNSNKLQDNVILTAQWVKSGTVSYSNLPGGSAPGGVSMPASGTVTAGTVLTLQNLSAPARWTFDGWYKNDDRETLLPGGAVTTVAESDLLGSSSFAVGFYAKWTQDATISFAKGVEPGDAGNVSDTGSIYVYPGNTISLPAAPTGAYTSTHSFAGWQNNATSEVYPARGAYTVPSDSGATAEFTAQWVTSGTKTSIKLTKGSASFTSDTAPTATGKSTETVILTATVKDVNDALITGGSAVFYDGATRIGDSSVLDGIATITLSGVAAGGHSYTAAYTGVTGTYNAAAKEECAAVSYLSTDKERPTVGIAAGEFTANGFTVVDGKWIKTYDGKELTIAGTITPPTTSYVTYPTPEVTYNGSASAPRDAGSYTVKAALNDTDDYYAATSPSYTVIILPKQIRPVVSANSKVYDGTESALLSVDFEALASGEDSIDADGKLIHGDSVIASASGTYEDASVGTGKSFTLTDIYISGGANRDNYKLPDDSTAPGNYIINTATGAAINPALVTFSVSNTTQVYDGNLKEITVVGGSSPSKEWELAGNNGFNIIYKYKDVTGFTEGVTLGTEGGGLGKKPVFAGTYTYEITCTDANYKLADKWAGTQTGTMTITSGGVADFKISTASLGVRSAQFYANTMHVTYGDAAFQIPAASATVASATVGYESSNQSVVTVGADGTVAVVGVGNAVITATLTAKNYVTTTVEYAVQVEKKAVTVTADNRGVIYGDAAPAQGTYSHQVVGLVDGGETLSGTASYACSYVAGSNAGSYAIDVSGLSAANYALTYVPGTLTVNPKEITPTITAVDKVYDGTNKADFTVTFPTTPGGADNGQLRAGDTVYAQAFGTFENANVARDTTTPTTVIDKNVTVTTCNLVGATNYVLSAEGTWNNNTHIKGARIIPATVTFVAANTSHTYDGSEKSIVVTAVANPAQSWTTAETTDHKGQYKVEYTGNHKDKGDYSYTITCLDPNYATAYSATTATMTHGGTMTIATNALIDFRFDQTLLINNAKTVTYGDGDFTITASSATATAATSGGTISYSSSDTDFATVDAGGVVDVKNAGTTIITATITHPNGNYADATVSYVLTVNKKPLTVTATTPAKVTYGEDFVKPTTAVYEGFVTGEGTGNLTGTLDYSTPYTPGDKVGTYAATPYGYASDNYEITYVPKNFSVVKRLALPIVTAEDKTYDGTTAATLSVSFEPKSGTTGVLSGDTVLAAAVGAFESKDVSISDTTAVKKPVEVTDIVITLGNDNYTLPDNSGWNAYFTDSKAVEAVISPAGVTYIVNGTTHTYDGTAKEITVVPIAVPAMPEGGYSVSYIADAAEGSTASLDDRSKPLTKGVYSYTVATTNTNYTGSASDKLEITASAQPLFQFPAPIVTATYGDSPMLTASHVIAPQTTPSITYTSSDPSIAEISNGGVVTIKKAGNVTITAKSVVGSYVDATATCALIISKAELTVTAADQTKVYGTENPKSTASVSYDGWKNEDAAGEKNIVKTGLDYTYSCETGSGVGKYTVTPSGLTSDCYDFKCVPGSVEITKRPVYVTVEAADKNYDAGTNVVLIATPTAVYQDASGNIVPVTLGAGGMVEAPTGSTPVEASGIVSGDIIPAAATGMFENAASGQDKPVTITATSLTGGGNYYIADFTRTTTADINEMPVSFTALYVPSQYSEIIGLTVIRDPNIATGLYTVEYYKADPTGHTDDTTWKAANSASEGGKAPVFPGTYWYYIYANAGSGYVGSVMGSYAIENMTQTGHVTNPVVTVNVGSSTTNPLTHDNPKLTEGKDAYGHAPVFTYLSSDPSIASINNDSSDEILDGTIHGLKLGTVTITVTSTFEGYFTASWQYSVTVSSTMIDTKLTETVQVESGALLAPKTDISFTPDDGTGKVTLTRGTGGATASEALTDDYSIFLRDYRAVGDNDSAYPYIQTGLDDQGNVIAGVSEVGHYYIYIRMDSKYAAAGYGDNKVQIGHFYVIPEAPTVGVTGGSENVLIDYVNETVTWDADTFGLGSVTNAPLSTWADDNVESDQYHNAVSTRPSTYVSPAKLTVGNEAQNFAAWKLGGDVNMSTQPGAVENIGVSARPAAPKSSHGTDPIQINVTTTANSITVKKLINYVAPAAGVQYAAWPTADKDNFVPTTAKWFDTTITGLDARTDYTVFVRVKASNSEKNFTSFGTAVTVVAPSDPGGGGGGGGGSTPTQGGGAETGTPPSPPSTVHSPDITEAGTLKGDTTASGGTGKLIGTQGEITVSKDGKTVEITAPKKYRVKDVIVNGKSVGPVDSYTFERVTSSTTLKVVYEWDNLFVDVDEDDWFFEAVKLMHLSNVVEGTSANTYSPDIDSLRVTLVTVLGRMSGIKESDYPQTAYEDVAANTWYAPFVQWATENDIVGGYGNGLFGVEDSLTREQVATLLYRYAKEYMKLDITLQRPNLIESYLDSSEVSSWSYDAMRWCLETGIISGRGNGILDPTGTCSRAELVQFLTNYQGYIDSI